MYLMRKILFLLFVVLILSAWSTYMSKREAERDRLNHPELYHEEDTPQMEMPVPCGTQPPPDYPANEVPGGGHFDGRHAPRRLYSA